MRKLVWVVFAVVVLTVSGTVFGSSLMGPPMAQLGQDNWSVGADFSHSKEDWKLSGFSFLEPIKAKGARVNRLFANVGYGANDRLDLFFRLGGAEADVGKVDECSVVQYLNQGDWGIAAEGGFRLTLLKCKKSSWGILAQAGYAKLDFDRKEFWVNCFDPYISAEARVMTAQIGAGPTIGLAKGVSLYGGPFVRFVRGQMDVDIDFYGQRIQDSGRIREKDQFGLYGGLQADLSPLLAVQVEYQRVFDSADAFATGLVLKF